MRLVKVLDTYPRLRVPQCGEVPCPFVFCILFSSEFSDVGCLEPIPFLYKFCWGWHCTWPVDELHNN